MMDEVLFRTMENCGMDESRIPMRENLSFLRFLKKETA